MTKSLINRKVIPGHLNQSGAVLVLSLVMLTVLTLIGVSSMSNSTLEMKVANNQQQRNIAFQAAQSRLAFTASNDKSNPINFLVNIPDLNDESTWPEQTCDPIDGCPNDISGEWNATAVVSYLDCAKGLGSSLESGKGFSFRFFEIVAEGQTASGSSRSIQASAVRYPVKGCGDEV